MAKTTKGDISRITLIVCQCDAVVTIASW